MFEKNRRRKYLLIVGTPYAGKLARTVWVGGKLSG